MIHGRRKFRAEGGGEKKEIGEGESVVGERVARARGVRTSERALAG